MKIIKKTQLNIWYEQKWDNTVIQIENKPIFPNPYFNGGIFLLYDWYSLDGDF